MTVAPRRGHSSLALYLFPALFLHPRAGTVASIARLWLPECPMFVPLSLSYLHKWPFIKVSSFKPSAGNCVVFQDFDMCATCLTLWPSFVLQPWTKLFRADIRVWWGTWRLSPASLLIDFGWVRDWQDFYANILDFVDFAISVATTNSAIFKQMGVGMAQNNFMYTNR